MRKTGNVELTDLIKQAGLVPNSEYKFIYLPDSTHPVGHWTSFGGWIQGVTLSNADHPGLKELRALLLIHEVHCRISDRLKVGATRENSPRTNANHVGLDARLYGVGRQTPE